MKHKVGEELQEQIQYYHRISVVSIVSGAFPIPLGIRFQIKEKTKWPAVWFFWKT
jgi:hypothetical protein